MKKRAFTLVEIMVVMAIISVLGVLIIGAISIARRTQTETVNRANGQTISNALEAMYTNTHKYCDPSFNTKCNGTEAAPLDTSCSTLETQLMADGYLKNPLNNTNTYSKGCKMFWLTPQTYQLQIYDYDGSVTPPTSLETIDRK